MGAVNGPEAATTELHCVCGERRIVPAGLRIVACVKCGRALGPPLPDPGPRPAIWLLALAAGATQLVAGSALVLAIACAAKRSGATSVLAAWAVVSAIGFIAGGMAHRGRVGALIVAAVIAAALAAMCLASRARLAELLHASGVLSYVTVDAQLLARSIAALAGVACLACLAALPQARRYAAWQRSQLELAFRMQRV
jgi:hypothetical protein